MTDMNVAKQAYATAKSLGASDKVMLALFEAGIVESNFTNHLTATDHDSLGFLQQRPSQGWPNPTDVPTATKSFVTKAKGLENKVGSAGALAQAVQISAFPGRYDLHEQEARALIKKVSGMDLATVGTATAAGGSGPIQSLTDIVAFFKLMSNPKTWFRILMFMVGVVLIAIGIAKLTRIDNDIAKGAGKLAKAAVGVAAVIPK